jgi:hypothetical protein
MLRLNPGDNQGIRYILVEWLLAEGANDAVDTLLRQYPGDPTARWAYSRALWTFRRSGAGAKANAALRKALYVNPFVPMYLIGALQMPRDMPDYIGIGDENEAVDYLASASPNWADTPGAAEWFVEVFTHEAEKLAPRGRRARVR